MYRLNDPSLFELKSCHNLAKYCFQVGPIEFPVTDAQNYLPDLGFFDDQKYGR